MKVSAATYFAGTLGALSLIGGVASAQPYHEPGAVANYKSGQATHVADVRAIQAQRDARAASLAARSGNYAAARALTHAADVRKIQADRAARVAGHDHDVAKIQQSRGY